MDLDKLEKSAREIHKNGTTNHNIVSEDKTSTPAERRSVSSWQVSQPLRRAVIVASVSSILAWF